VTEYTTMLPLQNIGADKIGCFSQVRGTVIRVGQVQQLVVSMPFLCTKCQQETVMYFDHGEYAAPPKCSAQGCRSRTLEAVPSLATTVDWQCIKLQEQLNRIDTSDSGRVPKMLECEVTEDLIDKCIPGDVLTVCGVIKSMATSKVRTATTSMYSLYLETNSIVRHSKDESSRPMGVNERRVVDEISNRPDVFRLVVNSIAPKIFGNELVKAGLALALFGGVQKYADDKGKVTIRGDSHVLLVGDPGLGKSQMLSSVVAVAPRGILVCGTYSTKSGLTVTLAKEKGSGDHSIEAGALLLADRGICCIDEFDKMAADHASLLEAMEQQCVSIAKAGIVCTLPARTAVVAAGNPQAGHYRVEKTIAENLKISPAMLSRFDLVFLLVDRPDAVRDRMISDHIVALHSSRAPPPPPLRAAAAVSRKPLAEQSLEERLRVDPVEFSKVALPPQILKVYIGFAKRHVEPKMTPAAAAVLQEFYLSLRQNYKTADTTPITTRQLESLIRLAEARAKLELSTVISAEHAKDVVELMKQSLFQCFQDEYGNVDFRKSSGMSEAKEVRRFVVALQKQAMQRGSKTFKLEELREISEKIQIRVKSSFRDFIETLNYQNFLLKKGGQMYQLCVQ